MLLPDRVLLQSVLAAAVDVDGAMGGNIQGYDPASGELRIVVQQGFREPFLKHFEVVTAFDGSACAQALADRRRIVIGDTATDCAFAPHLHVADEAGFRSVTSMPLTGMSGSLVGVLSMHWPRPHHPSPRVFQRLDAAAPLTGTLLECVRLGDRLQTAGRAADWVLSAAADEAAAGARRQLDLLSRRGLIPSIVDAAMRHMNQLLPELRRITSDV